ncbi:choice-of-anchor G family protein [Brachybacterium ginsengisoli]|uniref:choice-of-anchor G family protein n=1 Tax=Brachybacterium ginsengisoli TaxID=1331682 RepID=UPI0014751D6D|nr:choice-of-anchor G family protein [Brachybacterium ginsengisoli]
MLKGVVASFATASLTLLGLPAVHAAESDQSEGLGRVINADVLSLDLADAGTSQSGFPSDAGPNANPLNVGVINDSVALDLGTTTLPLIGDENNVGLLHLGQVGAVSSFASSPDALNSTASAGAVGEGGALDLDGIANGTYGSARVDLTTLLEQAGVDGLTDQIVDELSLELGALGSTATEEAGTVSSEYVVADGKLVISSPLVAELSTELDSAVTGVGTTLNSAVGADGVLGTVAQNASLDLNVGLVRVQGGGGTIGVTGLDAALAEASDSLLVEPLTDANGLVSINLADGTIEVDLQQLGGADGLNGLPANTELLDATTIGLITGAVTEALGTVSDRAGQVLIDDVFNNVGLTIELPARVSTLGLPAATVDIVVETTIGQLAGTADGQPTVSIDGNLLGIIPIGTLLSAVEPVIQTVLIAPLQGVVGGLVDTTTTGLTETLDGLINPVLTTLDPVLDGVLSEVVSVTINEQPSPGYLGAESFTVNALSLELLPNLAAVNVDLASSTVRAADEVVDPTIAVDPGTVTDGDTTTVTGEAYPANTEVSVQLTDADGNPVGDPVSVTTDDTGAFTTDLTVPEGTEAGEFSVVGAATGGETASAPLQVVNAPAITADPDRVPAGDSTTVTGTDFPADSEVTVQLQDADGNPIGDPVTVTTDSDGNFTTELPVPAGTPEGEDYVIEAVAESGESATTPLAVIGDNQADNTADNTDVNTEVNTAENTDVNTDVNTADNAAENTDVNTDVNTADNAAENTDVNTDVNTADNAAENTDVNTEVNTADNTEVNAADNTEVNTDVNTADNAAENTDVNTEVNTADNTEVNAADNTEVNTDVNTADNAAENTDVNTEVNTADNTEVNAADNTEVNTDVNTADNAAENTDVNTEVNTADNTEVNAADNTEVNTDVNTADNAAENTDVNTEVNTADNTEVNAADNTEVNTDVNTADNAAENTDVNTEVNTADNTEVNAADNTEVNTDVNTADNAAENTDVNTEVNTADNTEVNAADNTEVNTDVNTADNAAENTDVNTEVNTADNTEVNAADNTEVNTDVNTADNAAENTDVNTEVNTAENTGDNTADNTAVAEITVTPKRAVQGEDTVLVSGTGYTPSGTAEAYLRPIDGPVLANVEPLATLLRAITVPGEPIGTVDVDENGEATFRIDTADLEIGDYVVTLIDNEDPKLADSETFTVVVAGSSDNTAENTADNTGANTEVNTAENTDANTEVNTDVNTAENTDVNTEVNTDVNTAENTDVNTEANAEVNTAENTDVNTSENTADNAGDNATAEDPAVSVDPSTVEPGDSTTVTGEGFPPNTEVEVQLIDPSGNPVGDPVSVTTDEDGAFTVDLVVPEGSVVGDYTVEATAETGESATADLTVIAGSDDNTADNTGDNTGANTGANAGDNTSDNSSDNVSANPGGNGSGSTGNGSAGTGSGSGSSGSGSGSSSGSGFLAQTGAAGTAAMVGLAALLLVGGAAGIFLSRRSAS